ncbi:hypothetical protein ABW21_db0201781 [Orbilia brochopaga]|nr:hypothetical protein ABW21_db0201781 [Drechslerella brochopaga]
MQDEACSSQLSWIESLVQVVLEARQQWQSALINDQELAGVSPSPNTGTAPPELVVKMDDSEHALTHMRSNKLQLLMHCLGFETNGTADQNEFAYILSGGVSEVSLRESIGVLIKTKESPLVHLENGEEITSLVSVKRKKNPKGSGEGANNSALSSEVDFEFPDNLQVKKQRTKSKKTTPSLQQGDILDEEEARARQKQRKINEQKRREGIKSALYIASSDDDSDAERDREFFEEEKKLREKMSKAAIEVRGSEDLDDEPHVSKKEKKRSYPDASTSEQKRARISKSSGESDEDALESDASSPSSASDKEMRPEDG